MTSILMRHGSESTFCEELFFERGLISSLRDSTERQVDELVRNVTPEQASKIIGDEKSLRKLSSYLASKYKSLEIYASPAFRAFSTGIVLARSAGLDLTANIREDLISVVPDELGMRIVDSQNDLLVVSHQDVLQKYVDGKVPTGSAYTFDIINREFVRIN